MSTPNVVIPGSFDVPTLHIHVNPPYALYHYLVREGQRPKAERNPATAEAAGKAARARRLQGGLHGIWDVWEQPLAAAEHTGDALAGLTAAMTETVEGLGDALREAEPVFLAEIWPERQPVIDAALQTIRERFAPHFEGMARQQTADLDLIWPERIDAYLVADCYAWRGGYSHPLTIDVTANTGLILCETLLHEATHVADVQTGEMGKESLSTRLTRALTDRGTTPAQAWNIWHALIFAASGNQIRRFIDPQHVDYAETHDLYAWFGLPNLPGLWRQRVDDKLDEKRFLEEIAMVSSRP